MKKFYLLLASCIMAGSAISQVNTIITAPSASLSNGTTGLRAPNGLASHTSMRACYFIPASELSALNATVSSFGFVLTNTLTNAPANGTLTVYMMNTAGNSYTLGTDWSTATTGMTQVYNGVYNIPSGSTATVVDFPLTANFNYNTGNGLYVAYEYVGAQFATAPAVYSAFTNSLITAGATNATSVLPAATTLSTTTFRPLFRLGNPNTLTNELSVDILNAPGKVSEAAGTAHQISANIFNGSNTTLTNIPVALNINGTNPFSSTVTVSSLAPGITTVVVFPVYTPTTQGLSNIVVSVPADQVNTNNTRNITQSVTCNVIASGPTSLAPVSYSSGVGFNNGSGKIYSVFNLPTTQTLTGVHIAISSGSSNTGKSVFAVVANSSGSVIATSNTLTISSAELNTFQYFTFPTVVFNANTNYHVGLAQPQGAPGYFPLGATPAPSTPTLYSTQSFTGSTLSPLATNLGFFGIEPEFLSALCSPVSVQEMEQSKLFQFSVYPNPAHDKVSIRVDNFQTPIRLDVMNAIGQVLMQKELKSGEEELLINDLLPGVYFIQLSEGNKKQTHKFIKQ
jgi:hypothetical protein